MDPQTDSLGLIQWRKTHKLDTPEEQRRGWKCYATFTAPQSQDAINRYLGIVAGMYWIEPYSYETVPFEEQDRRVALKLGELTSYGVPRPPRMPELPLDTTRPAYPARGD